VKVLIVGNRGMIARKEGSTAAAASAKRSAWFGALLSLTVVLGVLYALGLVAFAFTLPQPPPSVTPRADAIVALTGVGGRLAPAVTLLEKGNGKRLLITGVNRLTSKRALKALLHGGNIFDCCADLGFTAVDTRGNAEETARWVQAYGYKSLIIVTADYHMPRSLVEFGAQMPGVKLIPYPIVPDGGLFSPQSARRLNGEYVKYLASLVRISVADLLRTRDA
jgi:uncharacterized SAM-binding protein YcdF (DUF218 family)